MISGHDGIMFLEPLPLADFQIRVRGQSLRPQAIRESGQRLLLFKRPPTHSVSDIVTTCPKWIATGNSLDVHIVLLQIPRIEQLSARPSSICFRRRHMAATWEAIKPFYLLVENTTLSAVNPTTPSGMQNPRALGALGFKRASSVSNHHTFEVNPARAR